MMDVDGTMEVHFQEVIIMNILSRLPVLSLLRFKCVSKCSMTLISEPHFIIKNVNHAKNNQNSQKILVLHGTFPLHCSSLSSGSLSSVQLAEDVRKLDWPSNPRPWSLLISFRISNEVYGEIPLPEGMSLVFNMNCINGVSALEGMLCVYSTHIRRGIHTFKLWILKDYDVKKSWNRLFTIQGTDLYSIPKYKFSDGEVLLRCRDLECGSVFKTSKESSSLWPQSVLEPIQDGFVYTESIISPKLLA
ncbi:hypothetical protein BC332_31450 [Capsicum chinense]|nr:hypothetical protein BC332_31450 [Capsicum chinense]